MSDPFDLSSLKRLTPKYLSMDSLKEALSAEDQPAPAIAPAGPEIEMVTEDPIDPGDGDISMHDQEIVEEEEKDSHNSFLHNLMSPTQGGAHLALNHTPERRLRRRRESTPQEEQEPSSPPPPENKTPVLQVAPLPESHLQSPAKRDHDYNYEIKMPIPAPWQENLPYILSTYLQLIYNASVLLLMAYFLRLINNDVTKKLEDRRAAVVRDATWCQHQFISNKCGTGEEPPHLIDSKKCLELEHCMEADPDNVRRLSMYASLVAEVIGEFVHPLSYKSILTFGAISLALIALNFGINYVFGFIRARTYLTSRDNNEKQQRQNTEAKNITLSAFRDDSASLHDRRLMYE